MKEKYKEYIETDHTFDKGTFLAIMALVIVFAGMFGWGYEVIFYYFNYGMKTIYYRGANFLPWLDIYAMGALLIYFLTYKRRKNPLLVFLISALSCGALEFIAGFAIYECLDGFRPWDYNTEILNFGNIGGFVCLRSVLVFGLCGLVLIYGLVPLCFWIAKKCDAKAFITVAFILCAVFLCDEAYNLSAKAFGWVQATDIYKQMGIPCI